MPILGAFLLGVLTAINPCQLAINVSALTYIFRKGMPYLLYVLGRCVTYTLLAWGLVCLIGGGENVEAVRSVLSHGEDILPYAMLIMGVFMLYRGIHIHRHDHGDNCHNSGHIIRRRGPLGALALGMALAMAFCPESAVFYFGIMLPMSATTSAGLLLPPVYALGAALPVVCISVLMRKAANKALKLSAVFENLQRWINILTGIAFVAVAMILFYGE